MGSVVGKEIPTGIPFERNNYYSRTLFRSWFNCWPVAFLPSIITTPAPGTDEKIKQSRLRFEPRWRDIGLLRPSAKAEEKRNYKEISATNAALARQS